MAGVGDLISTIPQILVAQASIPGKSISTARVMGSNDPTYGSIGWNLPRTGDGYPFVFIKVQGFSIAKTETNRNWVTYLIPMYLAVTHADTPLVNENFNYEACQWMESVIQVVASNRRLLPIGGSVSPIDGDVTWELQRGGIREKHPVFDIPFYGVEFDTTLRVVYPVNYQA